VQGFVTPQGRRILLINRANEEKSVTLPADFSAARFSTVDESTGDEPPRTGNASGTTLTLAPFAVTVLEAQ
ncbi:MAG TPA: hypothetical protein VKT75_08180, partial [Acidobacteriaceae bacterium]|nr:hypothetical protein [Acidobacteriaceae bacterium]